MEIEVEKQILGARLIRESFTYDDVLLVPKRSSIASRMDVDLTTKATRNIEIKIPLIPANMSSVTESAMAIAIAQEGGFGIIHRNLPIAREADEVRKVKRSEHTVIEHPYTIHPDDSIEKAVAVMQEHGVSGLIVVDDQNKLKGIMTQRDLLFETGGKLVREVMTSAPVTALYTSTSAEQLEEMRKHKVEKIPLVDENGFLRGLVTARDVLKKKHYPNSSRDAKGRLRVGASIGIRGDYAERTKALLDAEADAIVVDVAHGHMERVLEIVRWLKKEYGCEVIAGNVATAEGTRDLIEAGADAVKNGVGGGCFAAGTRILMSNGTYKNIEEITPGNRVINMQGKPVAVKKAWCTGIKKVSRVRSSTFYSDTYVTSDHRYLIGDLNTTSVQTIQSRGYAKLLQVQSKTIPKESKIKWKEIGQMRQAVFLAPRNIKFEMPETFEIQLKKRIGGNWRTGEIYETDVTLKPNYELGYIFGTFLGDGSAHIATLKNNSNIGSVRWYFGKHEIETANKLVTCIEKTFNKKPTLSTPKKSNINQVILYYKPLADFLHAFGKHENKHLPAEYLVQNKDYLCGLLDGLIDSDGGIEKEGRIRFWNTSKSLIELFNIVCYLANGVFPNNLKRKSTVGGLKNCKIENCKDSYVGEIINTGEKRLIDQYQICKVLENEETNQTVPVFDLEVDCPTHSFIANNAIVHNSICVTRIVAGTGIPNLSSILECAAEAQKYDVPLIADQGIRTSGDIVKALAAGASSCMMGNVFAGTDEAPGRIINRNGKRFKLYYGMASWTALQTLKDSERTPEGVESMVPYRGALREIVPNLLGGLRSGMSYSNARTIQDLWKNAEFVRITNASLRESHAHDVDVI